MAASGFCADTHQKHNVIDLTLSVEIMAEGQQGLDCHVLQYTMPINRHLDEYIFHVSLRLKCGRSGLKNYLLLLNNKQHKNIHFHTQKFF